MISKIAYSMGTSIIDELNHGKAECIHESALVVEDEKKKGLLESETGGQKKISWSSHCWMMMRYNKYNVPKLLPYVAGWLEYKQFLKSQASQSSASYEEDSSSSGSSRTKYLALLCGDSNCALHPADAFFVYFTSLLHDISRRRRSPRRRRRLYLLIHSAAAFFSPFSIREDV